MCIMVHCDYLFHACLLSQLRPGTLFLSVSEFPRARHMWDGWWMGNWAHGWSDECSLHFLHVMKDTKEMSPQDEETKTQRTCKRWSFNLGWYWVWASFDIFIEDPEKEVQSETHTSVDDTELFGSEVPSHRRIPQDVSWQTSRTGLGVSKSSHCV